jgi:hypothetical protein
MEKVAERIRSWGIQCRTCSEDIVLGTKSDPRYADFFSFLRPGSFRCVHGHTHTYDSDDVFFFDSSSETPANVAEILKNRANYLLLTSKAVNTLVG